MKLSKIYSFKKSNSDKILSFTFPFIDAHLKIRRGKRQHRNRLFTHEGRLFPSKNREKRPENGNFGLFLRLSIIALYKKSSLYLKVLIFYPKSIATFVLKPLYLSKVYL
jgi:hypothetical protein